MVALRTSRTVFDSNSVLLVHHETTSALQEPRGGMKPGDRDGRAARSRGVTMWTLRRHARCYLASSTHDQPQANPLHRTLGTFSEASHARERAAVVREPNLSGHAEDTGLSCIAWTGNGESWPHVHRTEPAPRCSNRASSPPNPVPSICTKGPACTSAGPLVFSCAGGRRALENA